jgi:hypothetical protein
MSLNSWRTKSEHSTRVLVAPRKWRRSGFVIDSCGCLHVLDFLLFFIGLFTLLCSGSAPQLTSHRFADARKQTEVFAVSTPQL